MIKAKPKGKLRAAPAHDQAKGYVDRVKRLLEQQKELGADISQVCSEAKETASLEPALIRFAARELLIDADKRAERDEKRHQYLHVVGLAVAAVESGEMSARQAAKIYSIGKTSIYKELAVREVSAVEMTEADLGEWLPPHDGETGELPREMTADDLGDPLLVTDKDRGRFRDKVRTLAAGIKPIIVEAVTVDTRAFDEIAGEMPSHLRRERTAA